jgi:hypothetical protein
MNHIVVCPKCKSLDVGEEFARFHCVKCGCREGGDTTLIDWLLHYPDDTFPAIEERKYESQVSEVSKGS